MYKFANGFFYPYALKMVYESAGTWPQSGLDIDDKVYEDFSVAPSGKVVGSTDNGEPCWVDTPSSSYGELIKAAEQKKAWLLRETNAAIMPLQDAVELVMATEKEIKQLQDYKKYRISLNRIDISTAPDIDWPLQPE
jgi:hypothetical protein